MEKQIKDKNKRNIDPFENALYLAELKLKNFLKSKNHKDSNIVQKVIDENIYVLNANKKQKYSTFYDNLFLKKNSEEKIYTTISNNTNDICSNKNLNQILKINSNKEKINTNIKNKNNYPINNIISNNDEDYLNKKANEETYKNNNNEYLQGFLKKFSNLDGISNRINTSNNKIDNNLLLNINSNINFNNYNDKNIFIGNKRYLDEKKSNQKSEKENIYNEIKGFINTYNNIIKKNNIKDEKENKIYLHKIGFFESTETLIIDGKPTCIIYLNRSIINKIYLIVDEMSIVKDKEIIDILNNIKNDLSTIVKKIKEFDENI